MPLITGSLSVRRSWQAASRSIIDPFPADELGADRKLVPGEAHRVLRQVLRDTGQLEHHLARLHHGDPTLRIALARAHACLGRLLGDRLVGEDVDPDLPASLDLAGHRDSGGLDLAVGDPAAVERLEPVLAEGDSGAALRVPAPAAALLLAVPDSLRHQHQPRPPRPPEGGRPSSSVSSDRKPSGMTSPLLI